ncbi:single-stranded DNA-binding protein [Nocardioides sp. KIGAM211]|uniref:Single-stranded DNA-binding protein n=1 Tax=Nocardioides luti TaxID=2761101 RepID=A0A7X0RCH2_9ACTN|nr:single-stranded DNA-binding protein [Nocardioides luti]MBB6625689.1 single-stranded DNA-binding protein [Nocardioides luti]
MTAQREVGDDVVVAVNEVRLVGRISQAPEQRTLPSGDVVWTFRVVVARPAAQVRSRQSVDTLECAVWGGRVRRSVAGWGAGDVVEVSGALRRRFFRAGGATASRVEVDVSAGRVLRRAATG